MTQRIDWEAFVEALLDSGADNLYCRDGDEDRRPTFAPPQGGKGVVYEGDMDEVPRPVYEALCWSRWEEAFAAATTY